MSFFLGWAIVAALAGFSATNLWLIHRLILFSRERKQLLTQDFALRVDLERLKGELRKRYLDVGPEDEELSAPLASPREA